MIAFCQFQVYYIFMVAQEIIKLVPKVELHDHLDGGLRPETVIDLAKQYSITLPSYDPKELKEYFIRGCKQKSLSLYLETFAYTVGVLQTEEALERVAYECMQDYKKENVVYAEVRFAPILHTEKGLSVEQVVAAVIRGMEKGRIETGVHYGLILCSMRNHDPSTSLKIAQLAVAFRTRNVVGFDIAGDESGNPPKKHTEAFQYCRNRNFNITIHAGEAYGCESIWQAIQLCGAHRIGHGTRLIDDMAISGQTVESCGALSQFVLDKRIPMEMCLTSNVGTGATEDYSTHPFNIFFRNNFRVFLCSDNRLMSDTNLTKEMTIASKYFGYNIRDLEKITINAMKSAFIHHNEKLAIIYNIIKKRYAQIREEYSLN